MEDFTPLYKVLTKMVQATLPYRRGPQGPKRWCELPDYDKSKIRNQLLKSVVHNPAVLRGSELRVTGSVQRTTRWPNAMLLEGILTSDGGQSPRCPSILRCSGATVLIQRKVCMSQVSKLFVCVLPKGILKTCVSFHVFLNWYPLYIININILK